jgi:hypothetical protein
LPPLAPEASVSTNFTTSAGDLQSSRWAFKRFTSLNFRAFCRSFGHCRQPMARTLIIRKKPVKYFLSCQRRFLCLF